MEPERGDVGAQLRIVAITGIHEDGPAWQAGFGSRTDLIERNLGLGLEGDRLGHAGLLAPGWIISPLLRQVEAIGDRQAGVRLASESVTATWQLSCLPSWPQY